MDVAKVIYKGEIDLRWIGLKGVAIYLKPKEYQICA
jgi:hypothetical protein